MILDGGQVLGVLDLRTWARPIDDVEQAVLATVVGPVLEVGCGPGRLVAALASSGTRSLGIDSSPRAVALAAEVSAPMVWCSVFDPVPDEGRWSTVLLVDGSIGIGGDPHALLRRCRDLVVARGCVVVEVGCPGSDRTHGVAHVACDAADHETIPWAEVGIDHIGELAAAVGFGIEAVRCIDERWFVWLRRA